MIAISTYSGECDGLGLAAEMAGIEVAAYCEADPKRRVKLAKKHPGKPIFENDTELTADAIRNLGIRADILFGGPPCQPYSVAGAGRAEADPRHRWPEMRRFIQEYRPRWVVVENVGGFVNLALDLVLNDLENQGYEAGPIVFPALAVGAPHRRDRCFVVAYTDDAQRWPHAAPCGRMAGTDAISQREKGASGPGPRRAGLANAPRQQWHWEMRPRRRRARLADGGRLGDAESLGGDTREKQPSILPAEKPGSIGGSEDEHRRAVESRLGRVLTRVSARLDEVRWPAWRGQEQHPWEPPRVATGIPERPRRIESLGLAVVPWQAYPIFALIKEMDDILTELNPDYFRDGVGYLKDADVVKSMPTLFDFLGEGSR